MGRCRAITASFLLAAAIGCAGRPIALPGGPGTPISDPQQIFQPVAERCAGIRTFVAELSIAGRSGNRRLRGRVHAGFERPGAMRLEGVAPFGAPVFVLVTRAGGATLWLPRDNRVLRDAPPEQIVEALAGLALGPDDLRAVLTGCVSSDARAASGRQLRDGWTAIELDGGATAFLRHVDGAIRVAAAERGPLAIEYGEFAGDRPARVRVARTGPAVARSDLTVTISQVEINTSLDPSAFDVSVPPDAEAMTIDQLRGARPLGGQ